LGELGTIRRYSYFSDRRISDIAADNNIHLDRRWRLGFRTPALTFVPQMELIEERRAVQRHEAALRIEKAIGQLAVEDFVSPPPTAFAKGSGEVTFAAYTRWNYAKTKEKPPKKGIIIHTRVRDSDGCRVEICLFASIDNCVGYLGSSAAEAPIWSSSSTWAIEEFIEHRGTRPAPVWDDDESIAVEILSVIYSEGMIGKHVFNRVNAEWFAEVYKDVVLDKQRWRNLRPGEDVPEPVDRIVIGAPLWVRSNNH
jgi:hypothetical protein